MYLYDSRAGDGAYALPDSDYNVAYLAAYGHALGGLAKLDLRNALAELLHVDLVDLRAIDSHTLIVNVLDGDRLWVCPGRLDEVVAWEAKRLTMRNDWWLGERDLREAYIRHLQSSRWTSITKSISLA